MQDVLHMPAGPEVCRMTTRMGSNLWFNKLRLLVRAKAQEFLHLLLFGGVAADVEAATLLKTATVKAAAGIATCAAMSSSWKARCGIPEAAHAHLSKHLLERQQGFALPVHMPAKQPSIEISKMQINLFSPFPACQGHNSMSKWNMLQ